MHRDAIPDNVDRVRMGEQGQHQLQGQDVARFLEATHGMHKHELLDSRGVDEGRLPVPVSELVRQECIW